MKNSSVFVFFAISLLSAHFPLAFAQPPNIIRIPAPISYSGAPAPVDSWVQAEPEVGEWAVTGDIYGCDNNQWKPTITSSAVIASNLTCKQDQQRTVQDREVNQSGGAFRNKGLPSTEFRTLTSQTKNVEGECRYEYFTSTPNWQDFRIWDWEVTESGGSYNYGYRAVYEGLTVGLSGSSTSSYDPMASIWDSNNSSSNPGRVYFNGGVLQKKNGATSVYNLCMINPG